MRNLVVIFYSLFMLFVRLINIYMKYLNGIVIIVYLLFDVFFF